MKEIVVLRWIVALLVVVVVMLALRTPTSVLIYADQPIIECGETTGVEVSLHNERIL